MNSLGIQNLACLPKESIYRERIELMVVRTFSLLLWLSLAVSAFAADVTGKWKATGEGPNGSIDIEFNFEKDGEKLTGTAAGGPMGKMPIDADHQRAA